MRHLIGVDELLWNCFSKETLEKVKICRTTKGPYMAQLCWDVDGLPFREQIIWILYSPRSRMPLDKLYDDVGVLSRQVDGRVLLVDDYDTMEPSLTLEMIMLGGGCLTPHIMTITLESGTTGHVAVFVGQGRRIDTDDPVLLEVLHTIVANLFYVDELKEDLIIFVGREKLRKFHEAAVERGGKVEYMTYKPRRSSPC